MNPVRDSRHILASVRLAGHIKVQRSKIGEKVKELLQGFVQIAGHVLFGLGITPVQSGEAESRAHGIVNVQDMMSQSPGGGSKADLKVFRKHL